jgi:hypothetical protein
VALLGLTGCSGSSGKKDAPSTTQVASTTTSAPKPTTTTTVPLFSFDNSVPPPKLINTGSDYKAIMQSLLDYANWIDAARPDAAFIPKVAAPGSNSAHSLEHDVEVLNRNRRRLYETTNGPRTIEIVSTTEDAVSARYVQHLRRQIVVDPNGKVIDQKVRDAPTTTYNVLMVRLKDDRWYLASVLEVNA